MHSPHPRPKNHGIIELFMLEKTSRREVEGEEYGRSTAQTSKREEWHMGLY